MKNWNLIFRRTHLFLGMLMLPWTLVYGLSTFILNHREHFLSSRPASQPWSSLWEKDYAIDVPAGTDTLREIAQRMLNDQGLEGAFGVQRQGQRLNINLLSFRQPIRLAYDIDRKRLKAETRTPGLPEVLVRLHERTGYGRGGLHNVWAVAVDIFCLGTLAWIGTGLYLWWKLSATRRWGFVTIGGGVATIAILLASL